MDRWALMRNIVGFALGGGLLTLREDLLRALGGGLALFLFVLWASFVREKVPGQSIVLLRIALLACSIMLLNFVIGVSQLHPGSGPDLYLWIGGIQVALQLSTVACVSVGSVLLPPYRTPQDLPVEAKRIWNRMTWALVPGLFAFLVAAMFLDLWQLPIFLGTAATFVLLVSAIMTGSSIVKTTGVEGDDSLRRAVTLLLAMSPAWILFGTVAEYLRGDWLVWVLSVLSLCCVMLSIRRVAASRSLLST